MDESNKKIGGFNPLEKNYLTGLTLLELIIGLNIMFIIMIALYSSLQGGFNAWKHTFDNNRYEQSLRSVCALFGKELKNAVFMDDFPAVFKEKELQFYTLNEDVIEKITYRYDIGEGILYKSSDKFLADNESSPVKLMVLDDAGFSYYNKEGVSTVNEADMPVLVKFSITKDGRKLEKTVPINVLIPGDLI